MENTKTISHLNSKAWYRLLKVAFVLVLLFVLAIFNFIAFSGGVKQVDRNATTIKCNLYGKNTFSLSDKNIYLDNSAFKGGTFDYNGFFEGYNDYTAMAILKGCKDFMPVFNGADSYDEQKAGEIANDMGTIIGAKDHTQDQIDTFTSKMNDYVKQSKNLYGNEKTQYLDFTFHLFDITPVFTYSGFLYLFIIGNIVILLVFEAVRRGFYYIVLGSLRPIKRA